MKRRTQLDRQVTKALARALEGRTIDIMKINPMHQAVVAAIFSGRTMEEAVKAAIEAFSEEAA